MGMSRCYSFMKCLLVLFNIVFLIVGCGVCGFAGWALYDGRASESLAGRAGLGALAGWAAALALGALAGLAGAGRGSAALLALAFALLALCGVAEAAAACWAAAHLPQLERALQHQLAVSMRHDYGVVDSRTQILDAIQQGLECCGAESAMDWQESAWARMQQTEGDATPEPGPLDLSVGAPAAVYRVPASCCAGGVGDAAGAGACSAGGAWRAACGGRVLGALAGAARAPLAAAAALAAAHALALLLTLALCLRAQPDPRYKA